MKLNLATLLIFILATSADAQTPDSCLKLIGLNDSVWANPDSVRVDSCISSSSYGQRYAKGWFQIEFRYYLLSTPTGSSDTIIDRLWTDIDPSYSSTRDSFSVLQTKNGDFVLRKLQPDITDTANGRSSIFAIRFSDYQNVDSTIDLLRKIPNVDFVTYTNRYGSTAGVTVKGVRQVDHRILLLQHGESDSAQELALHLEAIFKNAQSVRLVDISGRCIIPSLVNLRPQNLSQLSPGYYFAMSSDGIGVTLRVK